MDLQTQRLMEGAAGAGGSVTGIEDVFKIHLYEGTGDETNSNTGQDIVNGIDFSGDGGMVMIKRRDSSANNAIVDTERGAGKMLTPHNSAVSTVADLTGLKSFNNNGFSLGDESGGYQRCNMDGGKYLSYSFKKTKKFFDVVTYTGNGTAGKTVSHNLGSVPGMIVVKRATGSVYDDEPWQVYHRSVGDEDYLQLSETTVKTDNVNRWNDTSPTASVFSVGDYSGVNASGVTYVAYLFAHDEAEFGPEGTQSLIKCDSYTGNGGTQEINVGFEPQFLLIKSTSVGDAWLQIDSMRGISSISSNGLSRMDWDTNGGEFNVSFIHLTSTGFKTNNTNDTQCNNNGAGYIYLAIAAETGKTINPNNITAGSDVFAMDTGGSSSTIPDFDSGFPVDFATMRAPASSENWYTSARLIQKEYLILDGTQAGTELTNFTFDSNVGWSKNNNNTSWQSWMWKRHAGFDVIAYTGNATDRYISHNLGKTPEMVWFMTRSQNSNHIVWHKDISPAQQLVLNTNGAEESGAWQFSSSLPFSSTQIGLKAGLGSINNSSSTYLALLFASVEGISKIGYFTGDGTSNRVITTGFQPRMLIIRPVDTSENWWVLDTTRGWGSGDDKFLKLNTSDAQATYDFGAPTSTGFNMGDGTVTNANNLKYIYYAHA